MNCQDVDTLQIIERYLEEKLSPEEAEAFEKHYFECDRCFAELKLRDSLARELRSENQTASVTTMVSASSGRKRTWGLVAAAALLLLIVPVYLMLQINGDPSNQIVAERAEILETLGRVQEMPPYLPSVIRGADSPGESFRLGMERYAAGEYRAAVPLLEEAASENPNHIPSAFYLGMCYLATDQPTKAVVQLQKTLDSDLDAYQEEAHWYLAKAHFQLGNVDQGRRHLEQVAAINGVFASDAQANLEKLGDLPGEQ